VGSYQHGFIKGKSCLTKLITINEVTNKRRVLNGAYIHFSKLFNTVSHNILIDKLTHYRLDKWVVRWIENWLKQQAQRVVISSTKPI